MEKLSSVVQKRGSRMISRITCWLCCSVRPVARNEANYQSSVSCEERSKLSSVDATNQNMKLSNIFLSLLVVCIVLIPGVSRGQDNAFSIYLEPEHKILYPTNVGDTFTFNAGNEKYKILTQLMNSNNSLTIQGQKQLVAGLGRS